MKPHRLFSNSPVLVGLMFALSVSGMHASLAAEEGAEGPATEIAAMTATELETLDRFLSLSDPELEKIEQAIGRIRRMSPAERGAFRAKILAYRRLPDSERAAIRQSWGQSSVEEQDLWREMMHSLPIDERDALRAEMQSLAPGDRADFRRKVVSGWQARQVAE